jgi:hypothetical protein
MGEAHLLRLRPVVHPQVHHRVGAALLPGAAMRTLLRRVAAVHLQAIRPVGDQALAVLVPEAGAAHQRKQQLVEALRLISVFRTSTNTFASVQITMQWKF